jgi:hypothetical protein
VSTAGLVSATADRATVMSYLNQYRTNRTLAGVRDATWPGAKLTVTRSGGRWLLPELHFVG